MNALMTFLLIYAATYVAVVLLYLGGGLVITAINNRHPERRIQKSRRNKRAKQEIRQSLSSLLVTAFCLAFGLFAQHQGWTITPLPLTLWSALGMFVASVILFDIWFYFGHRFLHLKPFYRFHRLHHTALAPTVWSNYYDNWLDAFVMQSYFLWIVFILPIPPAVLIAHRIFDHFNGMIGHCGFEHFAGKSARWPSIGVCTIFHDQHHAHFNTNFANHFSYLDRLFGTIDPRYDQAVKAFETDPARANIKGETIE